MKNTSAGIHQFIFFIFALFIITALLAVSGCGCNCKNSINDKPEPVLLPCTLPSTLPNNPMGQLGIQIIHIKNVQRIIIPTDTVFEPRTARIKESAHRGLFDLAIYLQKYLPTPMAVSGYTDDLGSSSDDERLSEQQSRSLIAYLWTRGVPHECLMPLGIGKNEALTIASNRSIAGTAINRRIEITFKAKSRYAPL